MVKLFKIHLITNPKEGLHLISEVLIKLIPMRTENKIKENCYGCEIKNQGAYYKLVHLITKV